MNKVQKNVFIRWSFREMRAGGEEEERRRRPQGSPGTGVLFLPPRPP